MLTIFAIPKKFTGHFSVIQNNAIKSWINLEPRPEIILFGDEIGVSEICNKYDLINISDVQKNSFGTPLLNDVFSIAQKQSNYNVLCYVNCDIMLLPDFLEAVRLAEAWNKDFLMVGQRWDLDITHELDFIDSTYSYLKNLVSDIGIQKPRYWIDYFIFRKNTITNMPPFAVGRPGWDNWLIWNFNNSKINIIDASNSITAIHQNHDYSHHSGGFKGAWEGEEAKANFKLQGGPTKFYEITDAKYLIKNSEIVRKPFYQYFRRWLYKNVLQKLELQLHFIYYRILYYTRPVRHFIGIKSRKNN